MRVLLGILLTVSSVAAYDAVVFSNEQKITKDFPSIENLVSTASPDSPVVFIVNPDFTLGQFSREASAYKKNDKVSGLPVIVKSSAHHSSRFIDEPVHAPGGVILMSADNFSPGAEIYILMGEEWASMQKLAEVLLPKMGQKYTAIITANEAVTPDLVRVKRIATSLMEGDAANGVEGPSLPMPVTLPPYNRSGYSVKPDRTTNLGSCMLYLEGVNIVVKNSKNAYTSIPIRPNGTTWSYADGDVQCVSGNRTVGNSTFTVRMKLTADAFDAKKQVQIPSGSTVVYKLIFTSSITGYWQLSDVQATSIAVQPVSGSSFISGKATASANVISPTSVQYVNLNSVTEYALSCSNSQAAFFKSTDDPNVWIGVSVYNTEIQLTGVTPDAKTQRMYFTRRVEDCVGTFSTGSWMAIVSILILIAGFIFGYLMLNSVQTMDRFDDPKHKQIVINVRE
ncbi:hypothetical protein Q1695_007271 [Nippostrongylus brasiliensis]|nr:hypothetical protein Q1695_007271 [Nippostrongylus brasiliensis]